MSLLERYNTYGSLWWAVLFFSVIVIVSKANLVRWSFKTCPSQTHVNCCCYICLFCAFKDIIECNPFHKLKLAWYCFVNWLFQFNEYFCVASVRQPSCLLSSVQTLLSSLPSFPSPSPPAPSQEIQNTVHQTEAHMHSVWVRASISPPLFCFVNKIDCNRICYNGLHVKLRAFIGSDVYQLGH